MLFYLIPPDPPYLVHCALFRMQIHSYYWHLLPISGFGQCRTYTTFAFNIGVSSLAFLIESQDIIGSSAPQLC